jgi:CRISPR-associated protein (TIGR03986 family)
MPQDFKSQLAGLAKQMNLKVNLPEQPEVQTPARRFTSATVSKQRAGRAPYNFVPLPDSIGWYKAPPSVDCFHSSEGEEPRYSGYIDLDIEAKTRFYVRGMRTLDDYARDSKTKTARPEPFRVFKRKIAIPGSSLRGMIRSLVEILSASPVDPINGHRQLFFRPVASDDNPNNPSFEPSAVAYKKRMSKGTATRIDPISPNARAGYVRALADGSWEIEEAACYRVKRNIMTAARINGFQRKPPTLVWFKPPTAATVGEYHNHNGHFYSLPIVKDLQRDYAADYERGWLIRSGALESKNMQWIVGSKTGEKVKMEKADIEAYINDLRSAQPNFKYDDLESKTQPQPCFFVEWEDANRGKHVSIGHTGYFRLPYERLVGMANPQARAENEIQWDLAQAIFGRTAVAEGKGKRCGQASRIFFEDAVSECTQPADQVSTVLSSPKLTSYENYLVQESDEKKDCIHWDGQTVRTNGISETKHPEKAVIRGSKQYWHRGDSVDVQPGAGDAAVVFKPAPSSTTLKARIRFENLDKVELGAVLTALQLPSNCAHKIGMAKPLGFGSIRIKTELTLIDRKARYQSIFTREPGKINLNTGARLATDEQLLKFKTEFAGWVMGEEIKTDLWDYLDSGEAKAESAQRLKELKTMLLYGFSPTGNWVDWTSYLGYGTARERKPLPPASQVPDLALVSPPPQGRR